MLRRQRYVRQRYESRIAKRFPPRIARVTLLAT